VIGDRAARRRADIRPARGEQVVRFVRDRYASIAVGPGSSCCGSAPLPEGSTAGDVAQRIGYSGRDLALVPEGSNLGLGCGAPIDFLDPKPGETVLDLGSGPGLDAFLAARAVGPAGRVIGVDMTPEMIERARAGARDAGLSQVEFREGRLEALPVVDASIDAVTSNCVINLVPDKAAVFREVVRVLRPGGRLVISDIVLDGALPEIVRNDLLAYAGCVAGAMQRSEYLALVAEAGLAGLRILRDLDYLERAGCGLPPGLDAKMRQAGVDPAELAGVVRSITFAAVKPVPPPRLAS
jgi:arsenite methyltransferase